jgi:hypothetical protein
MNKLNPEHLHLLLDEPIYVLNDHFEDPEASPEIIQETEQVVNFKGENKKGILIISQETFVEEDEEFLFKGLNALNIFAEDVAIIDTSPNADIPKSINHNKRITFNASPNSENLYQIDIIDSITQLECHSINQIRNNQDLKKSFWLGLKAMFTA